MSNQRREAAVGSSGFGVTDIYFVLFRHKWKILICSLLGLIGAVLVYTLQPSMYRSDAKLLIRYVMDAKIVGPVRSDQQIRSPDDRGQNIINSEIELLKSRDLAVIVAENIGAKKILSKTSGGTNLFEAVGFVRNHLTVSAALKSSVITLFFDHPDPQVAQDVLNSLINAYLEKHIEIHKAVGAYEVLQRQTDQLRSRLMETEKELNAVKREAGIVSLEDAKKEQSFLLDSNRRLLLETEQDLVTRKAKVMELEKLLGSATNAAPAIITPASGPAAVPANEFIVANNQRLTSLYLRKLELLGQFRPDSDFVQQVEKQIAQLEKVKKDYEASNPAKENPVANASGPTVSSTHFEKLANERSEIVALEAKRKVLESQLEKVKGDAAALDKVENRIQELTRQKKMEEFNFETFSQNLEQARIDNSIESGKFSNISQIQSPSYGSRDPLKLIKSAFAVLCAGVFAGILMALITEYFFDQSVRRPIDIESRTRAPLFMTIPRFTMNGERRQKEKNKIAAEANGETEESGLAATGTADIAPWEPGHKLRAHYESLRDRLITYFEVRGMHHKPKLVAVTGCSRGSGVTSIAAGLAASLSETGDGNVLLVDFNSGQGAAHPFYRGKPTALPEALDSGNRDSAMVQEHLYWVAGAEPSELLPRVLPKRLMHLVPKLKASDYDYIIFDMPPISQTSAVPRLAGMMDMTFFVVESDKTQREAMERALKMLAESKANVATVLNKYHKVVPEKLHQEV